MQAPYPPLQISSHYLSKYLNAFFGVEVSSRVSSTDPKFPDAMTEISSHCDLLEWNRKHSGAGNSNDSLRILLVAVISLQQTTHVAVF
jgi:hypothetical protein